MDSDIVMFCGSRRHFPDRPSSRTTEPDTSLKTILSKPIPVSTEQALSFASATPKSPNPEPSISKTATAASKTVVTKAQDTSKKDFKSPCETPGNSKSNSRAKTAGSSNKRSSDGSTQTCSAIQIQVNPLYQVKLQRQNIKARKSESKRDSSTSRQQTSFDSSEEPHHTTSYSQTEDRKKSVSFETQSNVSINSAIYDSSSEQYVPVHPKPRHNPNDFINAELRYALSQSIPISSETVYDPLHFRQYPAVQDGLSCPSSQEATPKKRQRSASLAPGLPVETAQRRTRSCERVESRLNSDVELSEAELFTAQQRAENVHDQFRLHRRNCTPTQNDSENMNSMEDHERKITIEFCHLLEKSKQLFNGLRELPQYGHKQWSMYFGRTFDIYTRLWKYQQQHRAILDSKYGLKRWQIGEIASKIGQLYYHFYLRTSEIGYLNEAFSFYYAIRGRCYYTKANKEDKCELMVKKLRYYARFIAVCLLLKKMKLVKELIKELDRQIIEYGNTYDPDDQIEWSVVADEGKAFIHAEPVVAVIDQDNHSVIVSNRLTPMTTPSIERTPQMSLTLQEVLIVGSSSQQVKFSELTMDMFRMLQTLEREPSGDMPRNVDDSPRGRYNHHHQPTSHNPDGLEPPLKLSNPHKYLLFKPSPAQILVYLASGFHDLPANGALLLYLSADGLLPQAQKQVEDAGYDMGGLITTSKNDIYRDCRDQKAANPATAKFKEIQCLYPGDLTPFTRRPIFIIVDSDNSYAFQNIPRHFGQPMVILMSPLELPASFHDRRQQGSLFTLFLHMPLTAFCYCCDISNLAQAHWEHAQHIMSSFTAEATGLLLRCRVDASYISFLGDDFLRVLILRYVFCEVVLRLHRGFRARTHLTRCSPALPDDLLEHPTLIQIVMDLAAHLQVRSHFHDPTIASGPSKDYKD